MDYSTIIGSIDYATVATAMVAVGAAIAVPLVAKTGIKLLLSMFSR